MGSHHLLEALIRAEGSMAAKVLSDLGIDAAAIAEKVDEFDTDETTDATPQESAARRMELRVVSTEGGEGTDEVHLVFRDQATIGLAKAVSALIDGPITGTGPVAGKFVPIWTVTNELLMTLLQSMRDPVEEGAERGGKAALLVRRVLHDRLRRRGGGQAAG
nr:Clp protease N-terminal domain-containing protein [Actinophytocola oryzae]